jgi:hypothetical protein
LTQNSPQFCTKCGAALPPGQKFCTNCGATMAENVNSPTELASNVSNSSPSQPAWGSPNTPPPPPGVATPTINPTVLASPPPNHDTYATRNDAPPPPPPAFTSYPNNAPGVSPYANPANNAPGVPPYYNPNSTPGVPPYPNQVNRAPQGYNPPQPIAMNPAQVPAYAQKPKRSNGCLLTSIVLLLILAAGIGGFILVYSHFLNGKSSNSSANNGSSSTNNTSSSSGVNTPVPTVSSTEQLNLSLVYASVNITIQSVKEAQSFSDDSGNGQGAIVRINLQESNPTTHNPDYIEADALLLLLADGNTITSSDQQENISPDGGIKRANWIDFQVSQPVTLAQLTLRLGTAAQNQMDIPLKPGADLSKYQDKTANPNSTFQYSGLAWTLKTATLSYSYNAQQATAGNSYVIITLAAVNSSTTNFENNPADYIRLQAGGTSSEPDDTTTFPLGVPTATNASGVFAFLVPQGSSSFTLVMLAQDSGTVPQVTQAFQIQ